MLTLHDKLAIAVGIYSFILLVVVPTGFWLAGRAEL